MDLVVRKRFRDSGCCLVMRAAASNRKISYRSCPSVTTNIRIAIEMNEPKIEELFSIAPVD
jgi:hypothetical protein